MKRKSRAKLLPRPKKKLDGNSSMILIYVLFPPAGDDCLTGGGSRSELIDSRSGSNKRLGRRRRSQIEF